VTCRLNHLREPLRCLVVTTQVFGKIEINGFIKIPNFGDNKNFYFEYKINLKLVNLSNCSHASNKKSMRRVLKQIL
jgi:hypothetical protein